VGESDVASVGEAVGESQSSMVFFKFFLLTRCPDLVSFLNQ